MVVVMDVHTPVTVRMVMSVMKMMEAVLRDVMQTTGMVTNTVETGVDQDVKWVSTSYVYILRLTI